MSQRSSSEADSPVVNLGPALAVTSSTGVMSLAAGRGGPDGLVGVESIEVATERRHAEELGPQLVELLDRAGLAAADLAWLAVDVGPGRFTGLRVGLATVRGLAFAIGVPVVGVTSLEVLAAGCAGTGAVTAVIDARRQEVFQQVFVEGRPSGPPVVGRPGQVAALARGVIVGDGADRYAEIYDADPVADADADAGDPVPGTRRQCPDRHPMASDLLTLAARRPPRPGTEIEPLYLRDPDAKANIRTRPREVAG